MQHTRQFHFMTARSAVCHCIFLIVTLDLAVTVRSHLFLAAGRNTGKATYTTQTCEKFWLVKTATSQSRARNKNSQCGLGLHQDDARLPAARTHVAITFHWDEGKGGRFQFVRNNMNIFPSITQPLCMRSYQSGSSVSLAPLLWRN